MRKVGAGVLNVKLETGTSLKLWQRPFSLEKMNRGWRRAGEESEPARNGRLNGETQGKFKLYSNKLKLC